MPRIELSEAEEREQVIAIIDAWVARELESESPLIAVERIEVTDGTASHRWLLRFEGEEKDVIATWLTFHQRTLHYETQLMPYPEANQVEVLTYLLRRNAALIQVAFAFGPEDGLYLVGRTPAHLIDDEELDRIAGCSLIYVDDHFPTAMTLGFPDLYRRRRRKSR
jgi:hypothetical protein